MPTVHSIIEVDAEIEVEIWCGSCRTGLCGNTSVDKKGYSLTVDACPECLGRKDKEIQELEEEIERLRGELTFKEATNGKESE